MTQPKSGMSVDAFGVGPNGQYDELAYQLPNLYNGSPNFLNTIIVTSTTPSGLTLTATRLVKATPVQAILDNILTPPEVDANGNPYMIVLPQVGEPDRGATLRAHRRPDGHQRDVGRDQLHSGPAVSSMQHRADRDNLRQQHHELELRLEQRPAGELTCLTRL